MNSMSETPSPSLSRKTGLTLGAIALTAGLALGGIRFWTSREPTTQVKSPLVVEVTSVALDDTYTVVRTYTGEVVAGRTSELGFEQGGELVEVLVDRGDRVEAGQPLARLDTRRLQAQRWQLVAQRDRALAQLDELQTGPRQEDIKAARATVQDLAHQLELERLRQQRRQFLYTEGAISREDRDVVAFGADALEDRLVEARSQLEELQTGTREEQIAAQEASVRQISASIADLDIAIEKGTLLAPFGGAIAARRVDQGTIVEVGQPVLRLVEQATPEVDVGLPRNVVMELAVGQSRPLTIEGQPYDATVGAIVPEVDPTTRTQIVVFRLDGVLAGAIAPEQLAEVTFPQTIDESGTWLPLSALVQGDRGLWEVYALKPIDEPENSNAPNHFQIETRPVELLHTEGDRAFVRGVLAEGEPIVIDGTQRLVPGQRVKTGS